ncbi:MAG: isoaspartyl peptidase/L-asparaginase [Gammaproteobacteria bacterium]|nr:isoaspartyl peptidase/L-asparaginase [Gammaproteobacteria bacterium]
MNWLRIIAWIFSIGGIMATAAQAAETKVAIAIHGGAGTILKANMTPELEQAYHQTLSAALHAGHAVLQRGGSSVDAVQAAIIVMEDSELFNAGKGAVFTHHKTNEMDASIMRGDNLNAGAVTGVTRIKNPIKLAAAVMEQSNHVMLSGPRAEEFAQSVGFDFVDPKYFYTERRWQQLQKVLQESPDEVRLSEQAHDQVSAAKSDTIWPDDNKFGTVGAVALDKDGNLAAATSTGGMTNKKFGRIGDSPIIGAGTYADNQACAISATGHGEYFIRAAVAHDICARVMYQGVSLQQAADAVIQQKLKVMTAEGGIVGMSKAGDVVFSFNSSGMYRGYINVKGELKTAIYQTQ